MGRKSEENLNCKYLDCVFTMFCNFNKKTKNMFVCYTSARSHPAQLPACWPKVAELSSLSASVGQLTCPVLPRQKQNMNINSWIFLAGLAGLFWLMPVETSSDQDTQHVMREVQLALGQFQAFKEAKTFEDISFSLRVNRKYLLQTLLCWQYQTIHLACWTSLIVTGIWHSK